MTIHAILEELNESNSTNHKLAVLKSHKDNELLQRVLKMTHDNVAFTYGMSLKQIDKFTPEDFPIEMNLTQALDELELNFATRKITGHDALQKMANYLSYLNEDDADLIRKVINRDLRVNVGRTQINKVWKDLIIKPRYMRCGIYSKKTAKNITFPAILQLKADGTYREANVQNGHVTFRSRSGEPYEYPILSHYMENFTDGIYAGELTVICTDDILTQIEPGMRKADEKNGTTDFDDLVKEYQKHTQKNEYFILPRAIGNGLINSDNPPHKNIQYELWEYVTHEEYEIAGLRDKKNPCTTKYMKRWNDLTETINNNHSDYVKLIPSDVVNSLKEALEITSKYMQDGFEGSILKDFEGVFKDGSSKHQLKLKLEIDCEMRITGFHEGSVGTKREGKVGSLIFENDEGTIKGKCSGFSDDQLDDMSENPDKWLNQIITVQFNDLSKARGHDYHALSHPRFIEIRNDKDETDTLEKVFELREMAMQLDS